jgi:hypothetical protein
MKFAVLAETPLEIVDPDTQESLGVIEQEKIRVQAVDVQERFSVCATYEKDHFYEDVVARGIDLATFTRPNRGRVPSLPPGESYVKIGDRVRVIEEPAS